MAVIGDVMPKFQALIREIEAKKLRRVEAPPVEVPAPPPAPAEQALPQPLPEMPQEEPQVEVPDLSAELNKKLEAIVAETLNSLELLGGEVFEPAPVSKCFEDWVVKLHGVVLSFESSRVIGSDEAFSRECSQILGEVEEELAKRIVADADVAVLTKKLAENRNLLNNLDEQYAAQTKQLVVREKNAIDCLIRNIHALEQGLAEVEQKKISYLHPLQKLARNQKQDELAQKLESEKKRLALAVGTSAVKAKIGEVDAEYAAQTGTLEEKRKIALTLLLKNMRRLEKELNATYEFKTFNPVTKLANEQRKYEVAWRLEEAKNMFKLAEQNSSVEMEKLQAEYEKKKQVALAGVPTLEKDIVAKEADTSAEVRKKAVVELAEAVKALAQRKTTQP